MAYDDSSPDSDVQSGYLADQPDLASFWRRVGATLIDSLILWLPSILLNTIAKGVFVPIVHNYWVSNTLVGAVLEGTYCIAFWVVNGGRTPGDVALGLQVVREDGSPINLGIGLVRFIVLTIGAYALALGILSVIWDGKKQGWHDKAAGTLVVRL